MSLHRLLFLCCVLLPSASSARAEDASPTPLEYRFGDDMVRGSQKAASGEVLFVRKRGARESLVRLREHWLPELYRSVENL